MPTQAYPAAARHAQAQGPILLRATGHTPGPIQETVPTPYDEAFANGPAHVCAQRVPWEGRGMRNPAVRVAEAMEDQDAAKQDRSKWALTPASTTYVHPLPLGQGFLSSTCPAS